MPTSSRSTEMVEFVTLYGIVTIWTIWLNVDEPGFASINASASGFEKSQLSRSLPISPSAV
jgi:hypothetical protein